MGKCKIYTMIALMLSLAVLAQADVVVKQKSSFSMAGVMDMEMNGTEYVKADRNATETSTMMTGGMMAMFSDSAKEMLSTQITRLDKRVMWNVNVDDSTYSEMSFDRFKETASEEPSGEQDEEEAEADMLGDPDQYDWTAQVTSSDKPEDINGFKCKNIITTATGVSKTNPDDKAQIVFEYWYSKDVEGYDELMNYRKAYAKATGVDMMEANENTSMFFDRYGDQFKEMQDKITKAEGYPIKTVIVVKGTQTGSAEEEDQQGTAAGMQEMMRAMMGASEPEASADGMVTIMSISNTIESITKQPVDGSKFEVPAGFNEE